MHQPPVIVIYSGKHAARMRSTQLCMQSALRRIHTVPLHADSKPGPSEASGRTYTSRIDLKRCARAVHCQLLKRFAVRPQEHDLPISRTRRWRLSNILSPLQPQAPIDAKPCSKPSLLACLHGQEPFSKQERRRYSGPFLSNELLPRGAFLL